MQRPRIAAITSFLDTLLSTLLLILAVIAATTKDSRSGDGQTAVQAPRRLHCTANMAAEEGSIQVIGLPRCCTGAAALDKGRVAVGSLGAGACSVDLSTGHTLTTWRGDDAPHRRCRGDGGGVTLAKGPCSIRRS